MATLSDMRAGVGQEVGVEMHRFISELYPICRSITGEGLRTTLRRIGERIPVDLHEVPSGTQVLDWEVPPEWNVRDAYVADLSGRRIIDFRAHSLHILNYSAPFRGRLPFKELAPHLFSLPDHPQWIPYRTSYYHRNWGFCVRHATLARLEDLGEETEYDVVVDTTLEPGALTYAELVLPGRTADEFLISCHACHPSLANDNLSGVAVAVETALRLQQIDRRLTYRFLFIPGTIGSITWLALHRDQVERIRHGLVLTCVGDPGPSTYKRSRQGEAVIDQAVEWVLDRSGAEHAVEDFSPYGYDERQYGSPGFNLPVGCFMRTPNGRYPEYHTSADNLDLVRPEALADSLQKLLGVIEIVEGNGVYQNRSPYGEPRLGPRGLYRPVGGTMGPGEFDQMALLWVLNQSDGRHSLLDIARRSGLPFDQVRAATDALLAVDLLAEAAS